MLSAFLAAGLKIVDTRKKPKSRSTCTQRIGVDGPSNDAAWCRVVVSAWPNHDIPQYLRRSSMTARRTIVVHTRLAGHMARVDAARRKASGVQIMTMGQLAGRLAGGFIQPIEADPLHEAVRDTIASTRLGDLGPIQTLPGMVRAATSTLDKVWSANIDLSEAKDARLKAIGTLEREVLHRLPPSMKRPTELVELACAHIQHAPAVLGPIEICGHSEMSPCWRPLLASLAKTVLVAWVAGPRSVPAWLEGKNIEIRHEKPDRPELLLFSCAHPQHEVLEAFRWMRDLLASGKAKPEDMAIATASPADFDDHMMALAADANLPVHFVHGIKAVTVRDGQAAAALAEALIKGISQGRVRRLFALLQGASKATADIPRDWARILPKDAPLTTIERWEQAFAKVEPDGWPDSVDRSSLVLDILRLLAKGPEAAEEAGETLLPRLSLKLWQRALKEGPAEVLPVTLTHLRIDDGLEPASHVIWASAISLASAPRPYVRLLALNAGRWPRRIAEDRLIPDHIIPIERLDPLPIFDADKRDFATIVASAKIVTISYSRRDVEGRLLGHSPLIRDLKEIYLGRGRTPEHAASEGDRLLARPREFRTKPAAVSGRACWRDWHRDEITAHDGLLGRSHPRLQRVFQRPVSATSLKLLLRDPIRFIWRYALGWQQPEEADEPLTLDGLAFGNLVHEALQKAVNFLEASGRLTLAKPSDIANAVDLALKTIAKTWESEQPVPPTVIWRNTLETARQVSSSALNYPLDHMPEQRTWTEIPFGTPDKTGRNYLPWDPARVVEIPGTGVNVQGYIDRLDLAGDGAHARVIDYKTGRLNKKMAEAVIDGGNELQRCVYAFAVKTLLGREIEVEAALLYPRAAAGEDALFPLQDIDAALKQLATAIGLAHTNVESGLALPGIDAASVYNDLAFALPATPSYLARKMPLAEERLGEAANIWKAK
jgi:PD-(D/E)XK nuclease superfamily